MAIKPRDLENGHSDPEEMNGYAREVEVPVLIVGAGPAGLLQASMLSSLGVPSLIVERYDTRLAAPKAHELSPRSMEIYRHAGLDSNIMRRLGTSRDDAYWVNFVTKLGTGLVGRLPFERMDPKVLDDTPEMVHNIAQPTVEEFVRERLPKDYEIRKNHSYHSCKQSDGKVITTIEDRNSGRYYTICSKYVIACDGARSRVRTSLGIEFEGEDTDETMMTIHFRANLRPIVGENLGMLNWIMDPEVSGFIIGYDLGDNQVLICNFDSKRHPLHTWDLEHARRRVIAAIGQEIDMEVFSFRPWTFNRKVAKHYRQGNVFLVGDAAHCFPPTGGLGLNNGIADVQNLSYKIAGVYHKWARDGLLDTYESDRRPVALMYSRQAIKYGKKIFGLLKTMGLTDPDVHKCRENLYRNVNDPAQKEDIQKGIEEQREHFSNLDMHIGYVYGDVRAPKDASVYIPKFIPGIRLPHAWVSPKLPKAPKYSGSIYTTTLAPALDTSYIKEFTAADVESRQWSTLDLCARNAFTFFVGSPAQHVFIEKVGDYLASFPYKTTVPFRTITISEDLEAMSDTKKGREWLSGSGLNNGGVLLVRPDQHILAVVPEGTTASAEEVAETLAFHLGFNV